jgi:sodium-dependent dicarboxylate transporter 2/3/5
VRAGLPDGAIAVVAAIVLCAVPLRGDGWRPAVPWSAVERLPWGVYILFGGGLSLADAMQRTGLSEAIGRSFAGLGALPALAALALLVAALVFTSEIASNTALTATAVPIVGALAPALGMPVEQLVIATALGASYAFMLPVGTPPNAMVYATGLVPQRTMMRAGLALNLASIVLVTLVARWML